VLHPDIPGHLRPLSSLRQVARTWFVLLALLATLAAAFETRLLLAAMACAPAYLVYVPWKAWRRRQANRLLIEGVQRFQSGEHLAAERTLEEAARKDTGARRAMAVYFLALTKLRQGELARAERLLEVVDHSGQLAAAPALHEHLLDHVALCLALQGRLGEAREAIRRGVVRRSKLAAELSALPEAVILARDGYLPAAARLLEARWRGVEAVGGWYAKMARLVRAMALEALEDPSRRPEAAGAIAGARPVALEELVPLHVRWPEMGDFLREKGLLPGGRELPPGRG